MVSSQIVTVINFGYVPPESLQRYLQATLKIRDLGEIRQEWNKMNDGIYEEREK